MKMLNSSAPNFEQLRLAALARYSILDTSSEGTFDCLTALAASIFKVPFALLSLIDKDRQWIKSSYGLTLTQIDRESSFCTYTIRASEAMIVPDALQDDRFRYNPLVTGKPYFRFYAGVSLQTRDGFNVGTLSLLDLQPRSLNQEQQQQLTNLATLAMDLLEARRVSREVHPAPETERRSVIGKLNEGDFALRVMGNMGQGLVVFKADYTIEYANPAFAKMGGFLVEELVGKTPFDLIPKSLYPRVDELGLKSLPAWGSSYESELRRKDGTLFNALIVLEPIYRDEQLDGIVGVITDLTGQKLVEQQLRAALEKEKELGEMKTRLISTASHEFRTPLSAIISSTELLEHYSQRWSEEKKVEILSRISQSANKLTRLIEDILVYSRAEEGKLNCTRARLDLPTFCQGLVANFQPNATDEKTLRMVEIGQRQETYLDEKLLSHILTNLLSNGVKYSKPGGLVTLELEWQPDQVTFRVKDAGIGIPLKDQANLFEPFQRASNVGTISGTGFGLAIVKFSVLAHSGQIYFESVEGQGSTFTVNLPLKSNSGEVTPLETPPQKGLYQEPGQVTKIENVTENLWLLQQAIDASSSGILITGASPLDDRIIYASKGIEKLTGFSREEVIGKSGQFLEGADGDQPGLVEVRRAIEEERECRVVLRNYRKDGSLFWNELQLFPIRDSAGKVIYLVGIQNDVSDRIKAESALHQSEEKFKALVENSPDIVARLDRNARFLYINPNFETAFGVSLPNAEVRGKSLTELGLSDHRLLSFESHLNQVLKTGKPSSFEFTAILPGQITKYLEVRIVPEFSTDGKEVISVLSTGRDITDFTQATNALKKSEKRLSTILESITDAFLTLDSDWKFTYLNPRAEKLLQHSQEELMGQIIWDLFPESEASISSKMYKLAREQMIAVNFEEFYAPLNTWFEAHAYPSDGGLSVCFQDITKRKRIEEALRKSEQEYRLWLEQAPDAIYICDEKEQILVVNEAFCFLTGYSRAELLQKSIFELLSSPREPGENKPVAGTDLPRNETVRGVRKLTRKDSSWLMVQTSLRLFEDNRIIGVMHNITQDSDVTKD